MEQYFYLYIYQCNILIMLMDECHCRVLHSFLSAHVTLFTIILLEWKEFNHRTIHAITK